MINEQKTELVNYRITRAKETLSEVKFQVENGKWNTAINRLYYAVIALLAANDINAKTHNGVRQMFGLHFVKAGIISEELADFYTDIFEMRHTGDYDDFITFEEDKVIAMLPPAQLLITRIDSILATNRE